MAKTGKLPPKQQRFVEEYLKDLNSTQAAIRANYSAKNADKIGPQLLGKVRVADAIQKAMARRSDRVEVKADAVLKELALLGFSDIGQILDFSGVEPRLKPVSEIPESARRAISSMKVKRYWEGNGDESREVEVTEFRLWPKLDALKLICQHLGLLGDQQQINVNASIQVDWTTLLKRPDAEQRVNPIEARLIEAERNGEQANGSQQT